MTEVHAMRIALVILVLFFAGAIAFVWAHGLWLVFTTRLDERRLAEGRTIVSRLVSSPQLDPVELARFRKFSRRTQRRLLFELVRHLGGEVRERASVLAEEVGIIEHARRMSGSRLWWRRLHALRILTSLGTREEEVLPFFRDPHPAVRAQAAEWGSDHPSPPIIHALLRMLGDPATIGRFAIEDSVLRIGLVIVEPLAEHLESASGAPAIPLLEVAAALGQTAFGQPAVRLTRDADPRVRARAADVLGAVQSAESSDVLTALLSDADARVRTAAIRALGRIGHWPAAAAVAQLLRDPSFDVRRASGLALRSFGSPGLLLLGRFRSDKDAFAADMARQVLELPDVGREIGARA